MKGIDSFLSFFRTRSTAAHIPAPKNAVQRITESFQIPRYSPRLKISQLSAYPSDSFVHLLRRRNAPPSRLPHTYIHRPSDCIQSLETAAMPLPVRRSHLGTCFVLISNHVPAVIKKRYKISVPMNFHTLSTPLSLLSPISELHKRQRCMIPVAVICHIDTPASLTTAFVTGVVFSA